MAPTDDSDADRLSAVEISDRTFSSTFRGFDQQEVRSFLVEVSETVGALERRVADLIAELAAAVRVKDAEAELDEERAVALIGAEAAAVLQSARQGAKEIRERAEADAERSRLELERLTDEARGEREALLEEARADVQARETVLAEKEAEAGAERSERLAAVKREVDLERAKAAEDAGRLRSDAEATARALRAEAAELLRESNEESTERRRAMRRQYAQLIEIRNAFLDALGGASQKVVDARNDVLSALPDLDPDTGDPVEPGTRIVPDSGRSRGGGTTPRTEGDMDEERDRPNNGGLLADASRESRAVHSVVSDQSGSHAAATIVDDATVVDDTADAEAEDPGARQDDAASGDGGGVPDGEGAASRVFSRIGDVVEGKEHPRAHGATGSGPGGVTGEADPSTETDGRGEGAPGVTAQPEIEAVHVEDDPEAGGGEAGAGGLGGEPGSVAPGSEDDAPQEVSPPADGESQSSGVDADADGIDSVAGASEAEPDPGPDRRRVTDLFERMKSERQERATRARATLGVEPPGPDRPDGDRMEVEGALSVGASVGESVDALDRASVSVRRVDESAGGADGTSLEATLSDAATSDESEQPAASGEPDRSTGDDAVPDELGASGPGAGDGSAPEGDGALLDRRDEVLGELLPQLVRRLRRGLGDDQNQVLQGLRTAKGRYRADDVAPDAADHDERLCDPGRDILDMAVVAAAELGGGEVDDELADAAARRALDVISRRLGEPLRARLADRSAEVEDRDELAGLVRPIYRELKSQRLESASREALLAVLALGVQRSGSGDMPSRWVLDPRCTSPDCGDNALAAPVAAGEAFPSGHLLPPTHPDCGCLAEPAR